MKRALLATVITLVCLSAAHATDYRFFCTNQSDPAINPDHDGVFVAINYGTAQSFDVVHTIAKQLYNRGAQYRITSITHPASDSYFWEGFMLKDAHVVMTGHLWENEGVWMYSENQTFTDGRPAKIATPPVVCRNTVDLRQAVERNEQPAVRSGGEPSNHREIADVEPPEASVLAQFAYDGTKRSVFQFERIKITADTEHSQSDPTQLIPFITASDGSGHELFAIHLVGDESVGRDEPTAKIRMMKLDAATQSPQVVFTYFWAGAHCCTVTKIATVDNKGDWHLVDGGILDAEGYDFRDLDRDGGAELVSVDNDFLYAFCSYACSYAPTKIKQLVGTDLRDVTASTKYVPFLRNKLQELENFARNSGEPETTRSVGYLAGWVAAKSSVGELQDAWQTMLRTYQPDPDWPSAECSSAVPITKCPEAERRQVGFPQALASLLSTDGYITSEQKAALDLTQKSNTNANSNGGLNISTPLGLCSAAIKDPLWPMIIDVLIAGGKHISSDWSNSFKSGIESDYGQFVKVLDDATVEKVDERTGKIGCAVTYQANLQGLATKALQEGANARAQILIRQISQEGSVLGRRILYTVAKTSGGSLLVQLRKFHEVVSQYKGGNAVPPNPWETHSDCEESALKLPYPRRLNEVPKGRMPAKNRRMNGRAKRHAQKETA